MEKAYLAAVGLRVQLYSAELGLIPGTLKEKRGRYNSHVTSRLNVHSVLHAFCWEMQNSVK